MAKEIKKDIEIIGKRWVGNFCHVSSIRGKSNGLNKERFRKS